MPHAKPHSPASAARAMVFTGPGQPLQWRSFPLPDAAPAGGLLVRVTLSAICGSDLHTYLGHRQEPAPLILGHEIIGRVAALGAGMTHDWNGLPLAIGDEITWSVAASCGHCFYCIRDLPQKCESLHKYGHCGCANGQALSGGFAEHIVLEPGSAVFRLPDGLQPAEAVSANCALATCVHAVEKIDVRPGETVLIQGAGLLGVYAAALCRDRGAGRVIVADIHAGRLAFARRMGADTALDVTGLDPQAVKAMLAARGLPHGADVAIEVSGAANAFAQGLAALRLGGRYLIAGLVSPGPVLPITGDTLTRRCLTVAGIHNYAPRHLAAGLDFLFRQRDSLPFGEIVGVTFALADLPAAIDEALTGRHLRVAVRA